MLSGEATNTNFIVFGLIQPELEPTIYRTRGEHANHYATDAVYISRRVVNILVVYHIINGVYYIERCCIVDLSNMAMFENKETII